MIDLSALKDLLKGHNVIDDALMPWAYQSKDKNPNGRPFSDDLIYPFRWLYPTRMSRAYRLPLPFRQTGGTCPKEWYRVQPGYPLSPDANIEMRDGVAWVESPAPIAQVGTWNMQAAWIPWRNEWIDCYITDRRGNVLTKMFGRKGYNYGLRADMTFTPGNQPEGKPGDWLCWWPEMGG